MTLEFLLMLVYSILSLLAGIWAVDRLTGSGIKASREWESGKRLHSPDNKIEVTEKENFRYVEPHPRVSISSVESVIHHPTQPTSESSPTTK